ncbi:hypothetical protein L873DRAFT_1700046 [Choiromyces venosus 120613-1]|uniref:SnoaL-like domain-containing protein n=1 Tax=Choiromyces venosus 120613-1 TaxID=1336337 RepID=A0A3N4J9D9_9PEZI|nr:hypothetical protein L873DRAFT_1700046 [Choiromyces venosus 120613-1]
MSSSSSSLLTAAKSLCKTLSQSPPPPLSTILQHFTTTSTAHEHGLPQLTPFLGRELPIAEYFTLLADNLSFRNMKFEEFIVDEANAKVFVRGTGRFIWTNTGEAWDECFVYLLDYVKEEEGWKVGRYQVWADSGAAYLARIGRLKKVLNGDGEGLV